LQIPTPFPLRWREKAFHRWPTIGELLLAIEPLCLLREHDPIPSHLLIRNLYEGILLLASQTLSRDPLSADIDLRRRS
jgi:hypothetical protein